MPQPIAQFVLVALATALLTPHVRASAQDDPPGDDVIAKAPAGRNPAIPVASSAQPGGSLTPQEQQRLAELQEQWRSIQDLLPNATPSQRLTLQKNAAELERLMKPLQLRARGY